MDQRIIDAQMIQAMGNENQPNRQSCVAAQVDQVKLAKGFLGKNPSVCQFQSATDRNSKGGRPHEHGSRDCISSFLGQKNWSSVKVSELLRFGQPWSLSPKVLAKLTSTPDEDES